MRRLQMIRFGMALSVLTFSGALWAQDPTPQTPAQPPPPASDNGQWKRIGESSGPAATGQNAPAPMPPQATPAALPPQLTIKPGTYVTVRINQPLSSDKSHVGDAFSATLVRPIVVDGWVVAERGQTLGGRVSDVQKAGRVSGVSKLGVQLTDLPVADGQQLPVQTQLIDRQGPTSVGRDAAAIGGTTAAGAAIGAAAGWGTGAAIGAGAGAVASTIGVLLTRGRPSIIYPESVLTFRIEQPVTISTDRAPQTFRPVQPGDYQSVPPSLQSRPMYRPAPYGTTYAPYAPYGSYPYYGPAYYPYPYWGPAFYGGIFFGPRVHFGRRW